MWICVIVKYSIFFFKMVIKTLIFWINISTPLRYYFEKKIILDKNIIKKINIQELAKNYIHLIKILFKIQNKIETH